METRENSVLELELLSEYEASLSSGKALFFFNLLTRRIFDLELDSDDFCSSDGFKNCTLRNFVIPSALGTD